MGISELIFTNKFPDVTVLPQLAIFILSLSRRHRRGRLSQIRMQGVTSTEEEAEQQDVTCHSQSGCMGRAPSDGPGLGG